MHKFLAILAAVLVASPAMATECTHTYMRRGVPSKFDPLAHKAMDARYHIIDVDPAKRSFVSPKAIAGSMPTAPVNSQGVPLHGYVLIAYVITTSGIAESPTIVQSSDPRLSELAIATTNGWRFNPGKVDGNAACIVAMQEFEL